MIEQHLKDLYMSCIHHSDYRCCALLDSHSFSSSIWANNKNHHFAGGKIAFYDCFQMCIFTKHARNHNEIYMNNATCKPTIRHENRSAAVTMCVCVWEMKKNKRVWRLLNATCCKSHGHFPHNLWSSSSLSRHQRICIYACNTCASVKWHHDTCESSLCAGEYGRCAMRIAKNAIDRPTIEKFICFWCIFSTPTS